MYTDGEAGRWVLVLLLPLLLLLTRYTDDEADSSLLLLLSASSGRMTVEVAVDAEEEATVVEAARNTLGFSLIASS